QYKAKRKDRQANRDKRLEQLKRITINGRDYNIQAANKMDILTKELGLSGYLKFDLAVGAASDMDLVNYSIMANIDKNGLLTAAVPDYQEIFKDVHADFKQAANQKFWPGMWTGLKSIFSGAFSTLASSATAPTLHHTALIFDALFSLIPGVRRWVGNNMAGDDLFRVDEATEKGRRKMHKNALAKQTGSCTGAGD
ncbi:MAG: hypothetical protein AAFX99_37270, partial [Myxococcota bacterium]